MTSIDVDVDGLRRDARERAAAAVFLHGGYGLFGDLELQDRYCRRLAAALGIVVLSVDYRLAPEASLDDSVADAVAGLELLAAGGFERLFLCGDSAGGTVATRAASTSGPPVAGLLLTNPNLDLTLRSYDDGRPGGPGRELSEVAFRAWARVEELDDAPRLDTLAADLPPTVVAVGSLDSLLLEARARGGLPGRRSGLPARRARRCRARVRRDRARRGGARRLPRADYAAAMPLRLRAPRHDDRAGSAA